MKTAFLLTGLPGSGKTTAIRRILSQLNCEAGGFLTEEIRQQGRRVGFKIVTLDGREAVFAHVDIRGKPRVSKYGVDLETLEDVGVGSLRQALEKKVLVVIDEIGPMEIRSRRFREIVLQILESELPLIGTIVWRGMPFPDLVKEHPAVELFQSDRTNQDDVIDRVLSFIRRANFDLNP